LVGVHLAKPQLQHVLNVADALLVTDGKKTLAELRRQFIDWTDPSNIADSFRLAYWQASWLQELVGRFMLAVALGRLEQHGQPRRILINLDDSLAIKDPDTHHLQGVDWHYDHAHQRRHRQRLQNAWSYLLCNITAGDWNFPFQIRPYLRERTVKRLNRDRRGNRRLKFISKPALAQQILQLCRQCIPADVAVWVQFDAWYASADNIKFIRRQGWHVICRVQSNRQVSGQRIDQRALAQRHQRYDRVVIAAADGTQTTYLVRHFDGRLSQVGDDVRVLVSKRHRRDKHPVYFISTDRTLTSNQALQWYAKRWNCEVDHYYLKQRLGLGDFRLQSYEAIDRFCAVVHLAWCYVQWRLLSLPPGQTRTPAEVIRQHRDEHAREWLRGALEEALRCGDIEQVLDRYLPRAA
jgi:hypothetical protein